MLDRLTIIRVSKSESRIFDTTNKNWIYYNHHTGNVNRRTKPVSKGVKGDINGYIL